jgi:glucose-1-phosphatase
MSRTKATLEGVTALLFDIGGVVVDIDFGRAFRAWSDASGESVEVIRSRFEADPAFARYELGQLGDSEYIESLRRTLHLDISDRTLLQGWLDVLLGPVPGVEILLENASAQFPLYALSNSNPSHWRVCSARYPAVLGFFDDVFVSFQLGVRKPDPRAYTYALDHISCRPSEVLFFDNSVVNVRAARDLGMPAMLVRSVTALARQIERLGRAR